MGEAPEHRCPHCGKIPTIEDYQAGACPDTGEELKPWETGFSEDHEEDFESLRQANE